VFDGDRDWFRNGWQLKVKVATISTSMTCFQSLFRSAAWMAWFWFRFSMPAVDFTQLRLKDDIRFLLF
ncbi:MAG: hypothetical protein P8L85_10455, partial [Rubripirellula sp.]|nr:hypothetical protein [Rubripirellula sp.]